MHLLICAATQKEIEPLVSFLKQQPQGNNHTIRLLVTGVGGLATAYHVTKEILARRPDYVLQAGIAGSFQQTVISGRVVFVFEEILGDLGVIENEGWQDVFDLGLQADEFPFTEKKLINPYCEDWKTFGLPFVRSLSVNEINTNAGRLKLLNEKYTPVIESMEGGAFHYVCLHEKIPFMQLRAISNQVGERNKADWKMEEAIDNLNTELKRIIISLT